MDGHALGRRRLSAVGLVAGLVSGSIVAGLQAASPGPSPGEDAGRSFIEATHLPALLTVPGDTPELRYDVYCGQAGAAEEADGCKAEGTVFARAGDEGPFREIPLRLDPNTTDGRYVAHLPDDIASSPSGFSYYAVVRSIADGSATTVPAGGGVAPDRSLPLGKSVDVSLGAHVFGGTSQPDRRVAEAAWGDGSDDVGLEPRPNLTPIGGASFDVSSSGIVSVLDEAHHRVLRWTPGSSAPVQVPADVNGTIADLAVADDGSMFVLESTAGNGEAQLVRALAADGTPKQRIPIAERAASQLRLGPAGPVALEQPDGQWMPVADAGSPVSTKDQRERGSSGRPLPGGGEVVVLRTGNEVRVAVVRSDIVRRSWRITSSTPIGEVQLAEPVGSRLGLVFRVYAGERAEFVALVLGERVERQLSLDAAAWAETAPLARFRLVGHMLYRLGSTPSRVFVDRFDLGVH